VSLEDGAKFKGSIDMEPRPGNRQAPGPRSVESKSSTEPAGKPESGASGSGTPASGTPASGTPASGTPAKAAEGGR
jgi:hypothetical protein